MSVARKCRATTDPRGGGCRPSGLKLCLPLPCYPSGKGAFAPDCWFTGQWVEMESADSRHISRESMLLMADLRLEGQDETFRVKVRNLSNGGMMAEGALRVVPGAPLSVNLRNIGWVDGTVAWVQDSRFGIAFRKEVDARLARLRATEGESSVPRFVRPVLLDDSSRSTQPLRKL